jgi:hypothetical protein
MAANSVGTPIEMTILWFQLPALLDQHSPFFFTYHVSLETRYLIG